jgi:hypothetical protein
VQLALWLSVSVHDSEEENETLGTHHIHGKTSLVYRYSGECGLHNLPDTGDIVQPGAEHQEPRSQQALTSSALDFPRHYY